MQSSLCDRIKEFVIPATASTPRVTQIHSSGIQQRVRKNPQFDKHADAATATAKNL